MPNRAYRDTDPDVRTRLLARVAAGARLKHVCGEAGMPCYHSVRLWARAEPAFAAALAQARAEGDWRRGLIDEAKAAAVVARLGAGERVCSVVADPAMPGLRRFRLWRGQYAEFAEAVHQTNLAKREARVARCRARRRAFDLRLADRIVARVFGGGELQRVLTADPELPGGQVVQRWRRENAEFDAALANAVRARRAWVRRRARCTPELVDEICARIALDGDTLATIGLDPAMPCRGTLYAWMKRLRGFRAAVAEAWRDRIWVLEDITTDAMRTMGKAAFGGWRKVREVELKMGRLEARAERWEAM